MRISILAGCVLALAACGGHGHETVHDGTSATTDEGVLQLSFTSEPATPAKGSNAFTVTVSEVGGGPLAGAKVGSEIYVEGQAPGPEKSETTELGEGAYRLDNMVFPNAGEYRVTFHITHHDKGIHDHATFRIVIP